VSDYTTPHAHPNFEQGQKPASYSANPYGTADLRRDSLQRMSWGAVIAGAVVALVVQALLTLLGVGIGVASLEPATGQSPTAGTLSMAAAAWYGVSGLIASYLGGWVAGRLSAQPAGGTAGLHGLTAWAATTLVIFSLISGAVTGLVGGAFQGMSSALGGVAQGAGSAVQGAVPALANQANPFGDIERQIRDSTGGNDPAEMRDTAISSARALMTGDPAQQAQARDRAAQALARARSIPVEEARAQVAQYEQQYRETAQRIRDQAVQAAQRASEVVSRAALVSFVVLVLGGILGWLGGRSGTPKTRLYD
jgi:hypothetical protein